MTTLGVVKVVQLLSGVSSFNRRRKNSYGDIFVVLLGVTLSLTSKIIWHLW
jgi:hypothetical protein